jgi:predicted ATPase
LQRATAGNPFFLQEVINLIASHSNGGALIELDRRNLPSGIEALVAQRIAPLSDATKVVLRAASVMPNNIELSVLERVSAVDHEEVYLALNEAKLGGLLSPELDKPRHYRFNHGLTSDALRNQLSRIELMRLHRSVAIAIEELYGVDNPRVASRLAHHYLEAGQLGSLAKAIEYTRMAAQHAQGQVAFGEAARLYQVALDADARLPERDARRRCELLLGAAEVLARLGKRPEARDSFEAAAEISREIGDLPLLAQAVLGVRES